MSEPADKGPHTVVHIVHGGQEPSVSDVRVIKTADDDYYRVEQYRYYRADPSDFSGPPSVGWVEAGCALDLLDASDILRLVVEQDHLAQQAASLDAIQQQLRERNQ